MRVMTHIPDIAATTQQAAYVINTGDGKSETRIINTHLRQNTWVSLGTFQFTNSGSGPTSVSLSNTTMDGDGTGSADIAWDAIAFQQLPGQPSDFVVAMGDSYSSGEGAEPYLPGTDVGPYASQDTSTSPDATWNACRQSQNSWIRLTTLPHQTNTIGKTADVFGDSLDYQSTACSGAYTYNFGPGELVDTKTNQPIWGTMGQYHEVPQIAAGFLDEHTTLVALTIGGNDAGFSDVVKHCVELDCPADSKVKGDIVAATANIPGVLAAIHDKAPNAKIVLLGYPELFNAPNVILGCSVMASSNASQLNGWADYMETHEADAVATAVASQAHVPATFYWPNAEFSNHRICDNATSGINDAVAAPTGPGDFSCPGSKLPCGSMESYHPNNTGTPIYAAAFLNALRAANY
ncbi:SGNH/GDSL hydrolase family protein [Catenulispora pinisilvae]|uniref:SGNH/GDSL hydrolase family protein n=1 Tax=Catenulispora pinisilvae TaxID=2705253 RepID=UPI003F698017